MAAADATSHPRYAVVQSLIERRSGEVVRNCARMHFVNKSTRKLLRDELD